MDTLSAVMRNVTFMMAVFGGGLAAISMAYMGFQWMTSSGDPQKVSQVRLGVIGVVGGLILVGVSFLIPRIISEMVVEPSGGVVFDWDAGFDCDQFLRDQLVARRWASSNKNIKLLIGEIQSQHDGCPGEIWGPVPKGGYAAGDRISDVKAACFTGQSTGHRMRVGSSIVPRGLRKDGGFDKEPRAFSGRDSDNNILVYWYSGGSGDNAHMPPADGSKCWLYVSRLGVWSENY